MEKRHHAQHLAVFALCCFLSCSAISSEKQLTIQVVDNEGRPVEGAKVSCHTHAADRPHFGSAKVNKTIKYTNEKGIIQTDTGSGIRIFVYASGYYSVELPYLVTDKRRARRHSVEAVPDDELIVQLHPAEPQVSVYTAERLKLFSLGTEFNPVIERGVKLYPDTQIVTTDRDSADLWFTFRHVGSTPGKVNSQYSHQRKDWQIQLKGLHGWSVMEQPEELKESQSRLAPDNGYRQEIEFSGDQVPEVIFLQQNGGERYGKLYDIKVIKLVMLDVMVQAHPSDTRSLNPGREEDLILD